MPLTVEEMLTEPLVERISDRIAAKLSALMLKERWVSQAAYAKYYGISVMTVWRRRHFLASKGAVMEDGDIVRYDKTVKPNGDGHLPT
jgi:hypothetical protein